MNEWILAVFVASLMGSAHCVGMCGPFAMLAAGGAKSPNPRGQRTINIASYHLGRLTTYLILGAGMGALGSVTDGMALSAGWSPIAARVVGITMVAIGMMHVFRMWQGSDRAVHHSKFWTAWSGVLIQVRKRLRLRSPYAAAFSWGLISTWLPCGWLYVFALAAAGAGGIAPAMALMSAFWLGTLPLLSMVSLGAAFAGGRMQRWVQPLTACLLIGFGISTATSRAAIDLSSLNRPSQSTVTLKEDLKEIVGQELPCCSSDGAESVGD